jgi:hypothetical protein
MFRARLDAGSATPVRTGTMQRRRFVLLVLALIALGPRVAAGQVFGSEKRRMSRRMALARLRRKSRERKLGSNSGFEEGLGMPRGPDRDYDGIPDRLDRDDDEHDLYSD